MKSVRLTFSTVSAGIRLRPALAGLLACALLTPALLAQDGKARSPEQLAVFDGQPIYESQLPPPDQAQLQRMLQQVFSVRRRALQGILNQKLLDAEAKKKGLSVDDLVKTEVDARVGNPTDDEVTVFYQSRQSQITQPFDEVKEKIRQGLKEQEIQKARTAYMEGLMQKAVDSGQLAVLMIPPKVEVPVDKGRLRGDPNAPVTIIEFSDFSCPYCKQAETTVNQLLAKYQGKIRVGYRDFPLRQLHPQAQLSAEASRCAGDQNKYWEYHDLLFANNSKQGREDLMGYARALKLDDKQFDVCLNSGRFKPQIEQDIRVGSAAGVVSTPAFFIEGDFVNGAQPAAIFEKIIDEKLAEASKKSGK